MFVYQKIANRKKKILSNKNFKYRVFDNGKPTFSTIIKPD